MNLKEKNILVIDDTASIRTFLRMSLEAEGATFHGAATAQAGLDMVYAIKPDLVILDLGLPDKDGVDILPDIKNSHGARTLPVVILTVRKGKYIVDNVLEKGANAYLNKPFIVDDLLEVIHNNIA